ncbi:acetoacetyl-CoA synthetase [Trichonephila clavipes]|nr:acetoacetyl-CoA synthetase [Trichonephila clavipes]
MYTPPHLETNYPNILLRCLRNHPNEIPQISLGDFTATFGLTRNYFGALHYPSNRNFEHLKALTIGGSPVKIANYKYIQNIVSDNVLITNLYGATEGFGHFTGCDYNSPVYAPEVQVPSLGMKVQCFDSKGREIILVRFPPDFWMHVNTGGSKLDTNSYFGAGIHSEHFSYYLPVGNAKSAFDGEVEAIRVTTTTFQCPSISLRMGCYFP